jgi:hypothetical protein
LSGLVFGMVYFKYINEPSNLIGKTFGRVRTLYKYHIAIFFILLIEHFALRYTLQMELQPFWTEWEQNVFGLTARLLTFRIFPFIFHVLPLYILFFIIGPFVLLSFNRKRAYITLGLSLSLWIANLCLSNPYFYIDALNDPYLSNAFRCFNPLSWQLIFVVGIYLGYLRAIKFKWVFNNYLVAFAALYCLTFFVIKIIPGLHSLPIYEMGFKGSSRALLTPLRLMNFFFFVYLVGFLVRNIKLTRRNFFAFLGTYSLYVFVFHIFVSYNILKLTDTLRHLPTITHYVVAFFVILSLTIPSFLKENHKLNRNLLHNWHGYLMLFPKELGYTARFCYVKVTSSIMLITRRN